MTQNPIEILNLLQTSTDDDYKNLVNQYSVSDIDNSFFVNNGVFKAALAISQNAYSKIRCFFFDVIIERGSLKAVSILPSLYEWIQDTNRLKADEILNFLRTFETKTLNSDKAYYRAFKSACEQKDSMWIINLLHVIIYSREKNSIKLNTKEKIEKSLSQIFNQNECRQISNLLNFYFNIDSDNNSQWENQEIYYKDFMSKFCMQNET